MVLQLLQMAFLATPCLLQTALLPAPGTAPKPVYPVPCLPVYLCWILLTSVIANRLPIIRLEFRVEKYLGCRMPILRLPRHTAYFSEVCTKSGVSCSNKVVFRTNQTLSFFNCALSFNHVHVSYACCNWFPPLT